MNNKIGLVITSCGRLDLLERTIYSLEKNNTYQFTIKVLVDDSHSELIYNQLEELYGENTEHDFIVLGNYRDKKKDKIVGQFYSIDRGYELVESAGCDYVFHCEDDWEFMNGDFMIKSICVLDLSIKLFSVNLRGPKNVNGHPAVEYYFPETGNAYDFKLLKKDHKGWDGFSLNPGLRRIKDYKLCAPYTKFKAEYEISDAYKKHDFDYAVLNNPYVKHIGEHRSKVEY